MVKEQIIKSFTGSRGGFSKKPLAAGGIFTGGFGSTPPGFLIIILRDRLASASGISLVPGSWPAAKSPDFSVYRRISSSHRHE
jgi:hypothetical protein